MRLRCYQFHLMRISWRFLCQYLQIHRQRDDGVHDDDHAHGNHSRTHRRDDAHVCGGAHGAHGAHDDVRGVHHARDDRKSNVRAHHNGVRDAHDNRILRRGDDDVLLLIYGAQL